MLYCTQIKNFDDFNDRFGYKTNISGECLVNTSGKKQRKNNVLYQFYKESYKNFYNNQKVPLKEAFELAEKYDNVSSLFSHLVNIVFDRSINDICPVQSFDDFVIESNGVCVDNDISSIRYSKNGHIYKMKIGKYINKYLDFYEDKFYWASNPIIRQFFIEELTELWKQKRLADSKFQLKIDHDFYKSYTTDYRPNDQHNFNSCMDDRENYNFYDNYPQIFSTVRLEDEQGDVYARANLVTCYDPDNNEHHYLERIYYNKRCYADLLFAKAEYDRIFDLYKDLNATCHEAHKIYSVTNKNKYISYILHINLPLRREDYLAYQDTFKWYDITSEKAYNQSTIHYTDCLDSTSLYL